MRAQHRPSVPGWLRLLLSIAALGFSVPAMVSSFTSAGLGDVATVAHGAAAQSPAQQSIKPMFGALGKYITTAKQAKPWAPHGRQAYRVDIPIMSSMNPIRYRTVFSAPVGLAGMRAAGIKLVLTVRNGPWNTDLPLPANGSADAAFKRAIGALIDQLHPDYLVYGNEVDVPAKYSGTAAQFQHLMKLGHAVASAKGVRDGGAALVGTMVAEATYADIKATEGKAAARKFRKRSQMGPFHQALADKANAYIDACKKAGVDSFVWHSYFSDPSVILNIKRYAEKRFGGPSFINELGWRTGSAKTGTKILDALNRSGMPIVLLYGSGIGPNAPDGLWTTAGSPTGEGKVVLAHLASL
jgi:hypothetical protein